MIRKTGLSGVCFVMVDSHYGFPTIEMGVGGV